MAMQDLLEIDLSIPPDQIQLGHDTDGLPRAEPAEKIEKAAPAITQDDLDSARWQAEQIAKERDKFVRERDEARQAYAGSERELGTRTSQAIRAHMHAVESEHQQFANALSAVKMEAESAKRDLALAFADENMDPSLKGQRVADAQERISLAATDMRTLEQAKIGAQQRLEEAQRAIASMAPHKDTQPKQEQQREVIPPEQQTPDQWIKQFPPPTQRWLNEHKDYVTDAKLHRKLLRFADEFTDDHGNDQLHTSGFISALNDKFFPKKETETVAKEDDTEVDTTPQRRQTAPAAPVSRGSSSSSKPGMNGKVRLSAAQQDAALKMYSDKTPAEALHKYAQNLKRLEQDGISLDMPRF